MSYVVDGSLVPVIMLPSQLTGAVFGPNVTDVYIGLRDGLVAKKDELQLDERGINYTLQPTQGPLWELRIEFVNVAIATEDPTDPGYDPEVPVSIVWRLTSEFAEVDYRKVGRYEQVLAEELDSDERKEFNAYLETCLTPLAQGATLPAWITSKSAYVQQLLGELSTLFERGKSTITTHYPILARDASFRKDANYRAVIVDLNTFYTSAALIGIYPEIPAQFQAAMPANGTWKITSNDWEVESNGQGHESIQLTWNEWHDPTDYIDMQVTP